MEASKAKCKPSTNHAKKPGETLMDYICDHNEDLDVDDDDYLSPFDFVLEEVECKEVNEVITDLRAQEKPLVSSRTRTYRCKEYSFRKRCPA